MFVIATLNELKVKTLLTLEKTKEQTHLVIMVTKTIQINQNKKATTLSNANDRYNLKQTGRQQLHTKLVYYD